MISGIVLWAQFRLALDRRAAGMLGEEDPNRNAIERMFCGRKNLRRIATRYDQSTNNALAVVCTATTVPYWL